MVTKDRNKRHEIAMKVLEVGMADNMGEAMVISKGLARVINGDIYAHRFTELVRLIQDLEYKP